MMVVWTTGIWKRLLRTTVTFLILFVCICILSFLVTTSGGKWSSLAATITPTQTSSPTQAGSFTQPDPATQAGTATAIAVAQPVPTALPKAMPYIVPVILQNPVKPDTTQDSKNSTKHTASYNAPTYTRPARHATPSTDPPTGLQDLP
jgi:hypothetical protein